MHLLDSAVNTELCVHMCYVMLKSSYINLQCMNRRRLHRGKGEMSHHIGLLLSNLTFGLAHLLNWRPHLKFTLKMSALCFIQRQWCVIIHIKLKMCGWICNWVHTAFTSVISGLNTRSYDSSDAVWKWKKSPGKKTKPNPEKVSTPVQLEETSCWEGHKPQRQILCFWKQKTGGITVEANCWDCIPMLCT